MTQPSPDHQRLREVALRDARPFRRAEAVDVFLSKIDTLEAEVARLEANAAIRESALKELAASENRNIELREKVEAEMSLTELLVAGEPGETLSEKVAAHSDRLNTDREKAEAEVASLRSDRERLERVKESAMLVENFYTAAKEFNEKNPGAVQYNIARVPFEDMERLSKDIAAALKQEETHAAK